MEAKELMIGDKVAVRSNDGYDLHVMTVSEVKNKGISSGKHFVFFAYDEIEPINLTVEILESNGFEVEEVKGQKYYKYCAYYLYPDYNGGFILGRWHNKIGFVSPLPTFRYVHELQQGLRMIGYTDFANNLKVE